MEELVILKDLELNFRRLAERAMALEKLCNDEGIDDWCGKLGTILSDETLKQGAKVHVESLINDCLIKLSRSDNRREN